MALHPEEGVVDIQFDAIQKPGVMYDGFVQNKAKADGNVDTGRWKDAFVYGDNELPGEAVLEEPEPASCHWRHGDQVVGK